MLRPFIKTAIVTMATLIFALLMLGGVASANDGDKSAAGSPETDTPETCGLAWRVVSSPNTSDTLENNLKSVAVAGPDDVWAVGHYDSGNSVFRTMIQHWNGTAWSIVPSPNITVNNAYNFLNDIAVVSPTDIWAVGYYSSGSDSKTLILHYDGSQWSIASNGSDGELVSVSAASASNVWAVGSDYVSSAFRTVTMNWNGTAWSVVSSPNVGQFSNRLQGVSATPTDVYTVGYYNDADSIHHTLMMKRSGNQWLAVSSLPTPGTGNHELWAVASTGGEVWAVGAYSVSNKYRTFVIRSGNGVWQLESTPNVESSGDNELRDLAVYSGEMWAVGFYQPSQQPNVYKTLALRRHDGQWSLVNTPNPDATRNELRGVAIHTASDVWAVGFNKNANNEFGTMAQRWNDPCAGQPPCSIEYSDVPLGSTFYPFVHCLACKGIISGYADGTFKPNNDITRGQLSKIVSNAIGLNNNPGSRLFEDVAPASTFYDFIQRLAQLNVMSGYPCGGPGEPCSQFGYPYFRPNANATRGQIAKIVSNAAGFNDAPGPQKFEDVPTDTTFFLFVQRLANRNVMGGYPCGGAGEPCAAGNKPYFRPNTNATRGQVTKIISNTFYPECATP